MRAMKFFGIGLLLTSLSTASPAHAQVKFANFTPAETKPKQEVVFQDAKEQADLRHGTLVSLKLNNGTQIVGHVVRFDPKNNRLFVRSTPGEAPVGYAENDIKSLKKAVRQSAAKKAGKGRPRNVVEPEITRQVIINGTQRSVTYYAAALSPAERAVLDQLQRAENDLAALNYREDQRDMALAQEASLQDERLRSIRLVNDTMRNENYTNYPYPPATIYNAGLPLPGQYKGVVTILPQPVPPAVGIIDRLPPVNPQVIAKARDDVARLRSQLVYEDGRPVAVITK